MNAPEVGGGVKSRDNWAGGWSYVVKVDRRTVTVLDGWGSGATFERTIPLSQVRATVSRAKVEEKRATGKLAETPDKTRFYFERHPRKRGPLLARINTAKVLPLKKAAA